MKEKELQKRAGLLATLNDNRIPNILDWLLMFLFAQKGGSKDGDYLGSKKDDIDQILQFR